MILSDSDIKGALATGLIVIDPPPLAEHYQPSAVDIPLGRQFEMNLTALGGTKYSWIRLSESSRFKL